MTGQELETAVILLCCYGAVGGVKDVTFLQDIVTVSPRKYAIMVVERQIPHSHSTVLEVFI